MEALKSMQTKDYIAQILRDGIFSGKIADGEELAQEVVSEKLGVSRMPVREALQILELEGLLERLPNRHMRVIGIKKRDILQNFRVLSALECELASMLLEEKEDIHKLTKAFDRYKEVVLQEGEACAENEIAVHMQVSISLKNQYLAQLHHKLLNSYFTYALNNVNIDWKDNLNRLQRIIEELKNKHQTCLRELFDEYFKEIA